MAGLIQTSSPIGNSSYITISFWFIPPVYSAEFNSDVFIFNNWSYREDFPGDYLFAIHRINFYYSASISNPIFECRVRDSTYENSGSCNFRFDATGMLISDGKWRHVIIAIDTVSAIGVMFINATRAINYFASGPNPNSYAPYSSSNLPFQVCTYGTHLGMPCSSEVLDSPPQLSKQYADFQAWFGNFIDPRVPANFAKFVNITGGKGYPVDPNIAAKAFGTQTILFKGKASDSSFYFNRGNGGSFSKIGTMSDFTPTPSYG